jgi:hypothetical protein
VTSTNGDRRAAPGDGFRVVCRFPGADATDLDAPRMTSKEASTSSSPSSQSRSKAYKETGAIRLHRIVGQETSLDRVFARHRQHLADQPHRRGRQRPPTAVAACAGDLAEPTLEHPQLELTEPDRTE